MQQVRASSAGLAAVLWVTTAVTVLSAGVLVAAGPDSEELSWLSKRYPREVFDYCLDLHPFGPGLKKCLEGQRRVRKRILINAAEQLGNDTEARALYNECMAYYPARGVVPIGECVAIRLNLRRELDFEVVEKFVYRKCDEKWRRHSFLAINNCAVNSANSYHDKGRLPDW